MNEMSLFFFIGLAFSPLGAAMAFLITYEEYVKHIGKKEGLRQALEMAVFTFFVFLGLTLFAGFLFTQAFHSS